MDIDAIRKAYRRYAGLYDLYFGAVLHHGRKTAIGKMGFNKGDHILEVGVGSGLSLPLYPKDVRITGIDLSPEMLALAELRRQRERLQNVVDLRVMDAEHMEFADDTFDKVVAMYVVSVSPNPARLIREMQRVCKPDGELFVVNHFHSSNPVVGGVESMLAPLSRLLGFRPNFSLQSLVRETGLEILDSRPVNLFGYWTLLRFRNVKQRPEAGEAPRQATA